jgi:uncharacterized repeat protein (TIGR04076 family)
MRPNNRNAVVVVANDPIPSVSKKLTMNPMTRSRPVVRPGAVSRLAARTHAAISRAPQTINAPSRIWTIGTPTYITGDMPPTEISPDDSFELYDLRVEVVAGQRPMVCSHRVGHAFDVQGENLVFAGDSAFSMYALAALLPLLPAKQRDTDSHDWMTTDTDIACPDPNCGARFRITRTARRSFRHSEVTVVPLPSGGR